MRFDHGPKLIAHAMADWSRFNGTGNRLHRLGIAWQNAWIEPFNGRMRGQHLDGQQFGSLLEAQVLTEAWRVDHDMNRPRRAHGWPTPVEFAETWLQRPEHQPA